MPVSTRIALLLWPPLFHLRARGATFPAPRELHGDMSNAICPIFRKAAPPMKNLSAGGWHGGPRALGSCRFLLAFTRAAKQSFALSTTALLHSAVAKHRASYHCCPACLCTALHDSGYVSWSLFQKNHIAAKDKPSPLVEANCPITPWDPEGGRTPHSSKLGCS